MLRGDQYPGFESTRRRRRRRRQPRRDQRRRPALVPRFPMGTARGYFADLARVVRELTELIRLRLVPQLEGLVSNARTEFGLDAATWRRDQISDIVEQLMNDIGIEFTEAVPPSAIAALAERRGLEASNFGNRQLTMAARRAIGVNMIAESPVLEQRLRDWSSRNVQLVTKMTDDHLGRVRTIVTEGVTNGRTARELGRSISQATGVARRRAQLIARDQIATLNSQLQHDRMRTNGVTEGIWRTVGDDRVRDEHAAREGQQFTIAQGIEGERPGEPINCRCSTEPVFT